MPEIEPNPNVDANNAREEARQERFFGSHIREAIEVLTPLLSKWKEWRRQRQDEHTAIEATKVMRETLARWNQKEVKSRAKVDKKPLPNSKKAKRGKSKRRGKSKEVVN